MEQTASTTPRSPIDLNYANSLRGGRTSHIGTINLAAKKKVIKTEYKITEESYKNTNENIGLQIKY